MGKQLFLVAMLVALFAGSAFAAYQVFDVNVIYPTGGLTYYPNLNGKCIDFNIQVYDTNELAPVRYANIDFNKSGGDSNTFMVSDANLGSSNCGFHGTSNVWATGADCHLQYCFSTATIPNGTYVMDINVANKTRDGVRDYNHQTELVFTVNNRLIDTTTQAMLNLLPIAMALALILFVCLGMMGIVGMDMVTKVTPLALATIVGIIILLQIIQILLGA